MQPSLQREKLHRKDEQDLEIFIYDCSSTLQRGIFVQAQLQDAQGPLQVEALAIVGLQGQSWSAVSLLGMDHITYITDNQLFANNLQKDDIISSPTHRQLRPPLADFITNSQGKTYSQISKEAWKNSPPPQCLYSCYHIAHFCKCPVKQVLQNVQ
jgi:hypothetical protein